MLSLLFKGSSSKTTRQNQDIVSGVLLIEQASKELSSLRIEVDDYSHRIFEHSCRIVETGAPFKH